MKCDTLNKKEFQKTDGEDDREDKTKSDAIKVSGFLYLNGGHSKDE